MGGGQVKSLIRILCKPWFLHIPVMMDFVILKYLDIELGKISMQSLSHSWSMETRDHVFNSSRMKSCCDLFESSLERGAWPEGKG